MTFGLSLVTLKLNLDTIQVKPNKLHKIVADTTYSKNLHTNLSSQIISNIYFSVHTLTDILENI
jgi:hypothetical protein